MPEDLQGPGGLDSNGVRIAQQKMRELIIAVEFRQANITMSSILVDASQAAS